MIELARIEPDPRQPRKDLDTEAQRHLIASIKRLGILQAISVRYLAAEDIYRIISGERRYQAAKQSGLSEIPCWVQTPEAKEVLLRQIVENWQRADLQPYELADALAQLRDANGYSQKDLARETGKPESEISRLLSLLKLAPEVQQEVRDNQHGTFTRRHLIAVAQLPPAKQPEILKTIREDRLTAIEAERVVKKQKARARGVKTSGAPTGHRLRYLTRKATVTIDFRKKDIVSSDILAILDEVRAQVTAGDENANHRA